MKNILGLSLLLSLIVACEFSTPPQQTTTNALQATEALETATQTLHGMYKKSGSGAAFYDCASGNNYQVSTFPAMLDSLYRAACEPSPYQGESVYAVVQGRIHLAEVPGYAGSLSITQVDTLRPRSRRDRCLPYEFWCTGTEPFWSLLISEAETGIFMKMLGEEQGRVFFWSGAQKSGNSWIYNTTDTDTGEKLRIVVRQETCSDGMSDRVFQYSAELTLGGQQLLGCAEQ